MEDSPLTPAQLLYLEAFDQFLLAKTDQQRLEARVSMSVRLNFVLGEANLELPNDTRWDDSIDWEREPARKRVRRAA